METRTVQGEALINDIPEKWKEWQNSNPHSFKLVAQEFADMAIVEGFAKAENYLFGVIANAVGLSLNDVKAAFFERRKRQW